MDGVEKMIIWIIVIAIFCFLLGIAAGLLISAPSGYEDKNGFHFGEKK